MLIRNVDSGSEKLFHVSCSNWESVVAAKSPEESASVAFKEARESLEESMYIAPSIVVIDISTSCKSFDMDTNTEILYTPEVMANAGFHSLSKTYDKIIKHNPGESRVCEFEN